MFKNILISLIGITMLNACATTYTKSRNYCLSYTITGDQDAPWVPTDFYQDLAANKLYLQLPKNIDFVPEVRVVDTEYGQPYNIDYDYDPRLHQIEVRDNYNEYVLTRSSYDELLHDKVYISCNRSIKIKNTK